MLILYMPPAKFGQFLVNFTTKTNPLSHASTQGTLHSDLSKDFYKHRQRLSIIILGGEFFPQNLFFFSKRISLTEIENFSMSASNLFAK